jgi:hypothetical protein
MAEISKFPLLHHFRSEASHYVFRFSGGHVAAQGRGLSFWFLPLRTSVAEVPLDDRDLPFVFHGRSQDYQAVTVQGVVTWRVRDVERLTERVDFTIDTGSGGYLAEPLDQIATLLTGLLQQYAIQRIVRAPVVTLIQEGPESLQQALEPNLIGDPRLEDMGLEVLSLRVAAVQPTAELESALQTPTWEALQQKADEATFARRALAVEKERAIAENELENQIELSRQQMQLIEQEGENARRRAKDSIDAKRIEADGEAERLRTTEQARVDMEQARIDIYRDLPVSVLTGLAARDLAKKLTKIEHLNVTPHLLGPLFADLARAGTDRLRLPEKT